MPFFGSIKDQVQLAAKLLRHKEKHIPPQKNSLTDKKALNFPLHLPSPVQRCKPNYTLLTLSSTEDFSSNNLTYMDVYLLLTKTLKRDYFHREKEN